MSAATPSRTQGRAPASRPAAARGAAPRTATGRARRSPAPKRSIVLALAGLALRPLRSRPATALVVLAGIGLFGSIAVNALVMQHGPHPHPLFRAPPAEIVGNAADPALVRDIQQGLSDLGYYRGPVDGIPTEATLAAAGAFAAAHGDKGAPELSAALLARILVGTPPPAPTAPAKPATASAPAPATPTKTKTADVKAVATSTVKTAPAKAASAGPVTVAVTPAKGGSVEVMRLQKALADLGYGPLTIDGLVGGQTAAAIRRFRLDHGLPLSGAIDDRLVETMVRIGGMPPG